MLRVKNVFLARLDIHRKSELIAENKPQNAQRQSGRGFYGVQPIQTIPFFQIRRNFILYFSKTISFP